MREISQKNNKIIIKRFLYFYVFAFSCFMAFAFLSINIHAQTQISPDAIAIRVIPNPEHYSALRWYQEQGFLGSPQLLIIDGYVAVRDGRTVYVNATNAIGNNLYTNIYFISHNQDTEQATQDIFGQILEHWHFNANLISSGNCVSEDFIFGDDCSVDSDCSNSEYCLSQKTTAIRDAKRLEDLAEIKIALDSYKQRNNHYPSLNSGSYLPNRTISVWPSWRETLTKELNIALPVDPINVLGECCPEGAENCNHDYSYNTQTCWDKDNKSFAGSIPYDMPSRSRVYAYSTDSDGISYVLCAQMETGHTYGNIAEFSCFEDELPNNPPEIIGANLTGLPKQEFIGHVSATDPDGDFLTYSIVLITPSNSNEWVNWEWDSGYDNFAIRDTATPSQKEVHAVKAGNASAQGMYQIRITVDDGRGGSDSQVFDITINSHAMTLDSNSRNIIIGQPLTLNLSGTDASGNPLAQLYFDSADLNDMPINSEAELNSHGFTIASMDLIEMYPHNDIQKTGSYVINVYALDSTTATRIDSSFGVTIENNPPVINNLTANYANGDSEICNLPDSCAFMIDNAETANMQIGAIDNDSGHTAQYSLVNNPENALTIDANTGMIIGFENLNFHNQVESSYDIEIRVSDQYCGNSQETECSATVNFIITVDKWCSVDPSDLAGYANVLHMQIPSSFEMSKNEEYTDDLMSALGFPTFGSCSKIGNASSTVIASGVTSNKAIVFVTDTSGSMNGQFLDPIPIEPNRPIDYAKIAVIDTLNDLYTKATDGNLPEEVSIYVGLINFSNTVSYVDLLDISVTSNLNEFTNSVDGYSIDGGTHTLNALNRAETMLLASGADEKIIVLLSDGIPTDASYYDCHCSCYDDCCWYCGCPCSDSDEWEAEGSSCGNHCDGHTPPSPPTTFNNNSDFKIAVTVQTECLDCSCDPACNVSNSGCDKCNLEPNPWCAKSYNANCDISGNTATQADCLTGIFHPECSIVSNFKLYTIFYDTGGASNAGDMCDWSSDISCPTGGTYAFSGTDVSALLESVVDGIFSKPGTLADPVEINEEIVPFVYNSTALTETLYGWNGLDGFLSCSDNNIRLWVNDFVGGGTITVKNTEFDYCEPLLHP